MANTHTQLIVHMIFSTKYRQSTLSLQARPRLYEFIAGIIRNLGGKIVIANGVADHIHILTYMPARLSVADLARKVKASSSGWLTDSRLARVFGGWQTGYCGLSVSWSDLEKVRNYIANQEEHHRTETYEEEVRRLLDEAGVEYDEEFLLG